MRSMIKEILTQVYNLDDVKKVACILWIRNYVHKNCCVGPCR